MKPEPHYVRIEKHVGPVRRWICYSDKVGWTGPSFRSKQAARQWALKIGYQVQD